MAELLDVETALLVTTIDTVEERPLTTQGRRLRRREADQLEELAKYRWHCTFMAPLWGLQMNNPDQLKKQIKQMGRVLTDDIVNRPALRHHEQVRVSISVTSALATAAVLEVAPPIPGLHVRVLSGERVLAEMALCGDPALAARHLPRSCQPDCLWLPLQLSRGDVTVVDLIRERWALSYSASTSESEFRQVDMMWLAALWMGESSSVQNVELVYSAPQSVKEAGLETISVAISAEQMQQIAISLHPVSSGSSLRRMEMGKFHALLHRLMADMMGIPLLQFRLEKLVTPLATVLANGQFQAKSAPAFQQCLPVLLQLAGEFFYQ